MIRETRHWHLKMTCNAYNGSLITLCFLNQNLMFLHVPNNFGFPLSIILSLLCFYGFGFFMLKIYNQLFTPNDTNYPFFFFYLSPWPLLHKFNFLHYCILWGILISITLLLLVCVRIIPYLYNLCVYFVN